MKLKPILLILMGWSQIALAQWSGNPGAPVRVCSKNSTQTGCWTFPDRNGGNFVFWLDNRNGGGTNDVALVSQHYDEAGNRLFPDTGKVVVFHPTLKTTDISVARDTGDHFWIAWCLTTQTRMDSIVVGKFDRTSLEPLWPSTRTITRMNTAAFNVLYTESIRLFPVADSLLVLYHVTWMGGSTAKFVNRVSKEGKVWHPYGKSFTGNNQGNGPSTAVVNPDGTLILVQRNSNGLGTGVTAWKFNRRMDLNWGPKSITAGTSGLGYEFKVLPDRAGGFIMGYISASPTNFMATRVDSSGNFVWNPAHKPVCDHTSGQDGPEMAENGGHIYAVWNDNRPPANNSDVFMQKLNPSNGERVWNPLGRRIFRLNSYIPVPKILALRNGELLVTSHHNSIGFVGQRVRPDSSLVWPGYGLVVVQGNSLTPDYGNYSMSEGSNGTVFLAWQGFSNDKIYIAGVAPGGQLLTDVQRVHPKESPFRVFPNPTSGPFTLEGLPNGTQILKVLDLAGKEILSQPVEVREGKASFRFQLKPGSYRLVAERHQIALLIQ